MNVPAQSSVTPAVIKIISASVSVYVPVVSSNTLAISVHDSGITGEVVSSIVMICSEVASLPQRSVAVQVLVIVPVYPPHPERSSTSLYVIPINPQLSVAVAVPVKVGAEGTEATP